MTIKDIIQNIGGKSKERKEKFREMDDDLRMQKILEQRTKPSNERELEHFIEKERQDKIKIELERYRKKEKDDINFNHNPLFTKNIMKSKYEVMKEKNMFTNNKNLFTHQKSVLKGNKKLLNNGGLKLCH